MAKRLHPISRLKFRDQVARFMRSTRGYGQYDIMAELSGEMDMYVSEGGSVEDYEGMIPTFWPDVTRTVETEVGLHLVSDPVNAIVVNPMIDNSQTLDLTAFDIIGDNSDHWCDFVRDFDGNAVNMMFNAQPPLTQGTIGYTGVRSQFALPRNPMFAIRLWRAMPSDSITTDARRQMKTRIRFGLLTQAIQDLIGETHGHEVAIEIPYEAPVRVWWKEVHQSGNKWELMQGATRGLRWGSTATPKNMANAQLTTLWIGCFRNGLVISGDKFRDDCMYLEFPISESIVDDPHMVSEAESLRRWNGVDVDGWINHVPAGEVEIAHNAGMWGFSFLPLLVTDTTTSGGTETVNVHKLYGPLHRVGYRASWQAALHAEEFVLQARQRHKTQPDGARDEEYLGGFIAEENLANYNQNAKVHLHDVSGGDPADGLPPKRAIGSDTKLREWLGEFECTRWAYRFTRNYGQCPMQQYQNAGDPDPALSSVFTTELTPELYAVNIAEFAKVYVDDSPGETDFTAQVMSLGYSFPPDSSTAQVDVVLDNKLAELRELRDQGAREATVELGYRSDDESTAYTKKLTGVVMDPVAIESALAVPVVTASIVDFSVLLTKAKGDALLPCFDGWAAWRVYQFLLRRCGFDDSEMGIVEDGEEHFSVDMTDVTKGVEDTRTYLSIGAPEEALWQLEPNRSIGAFFRTIADFEYDGTWWFSPDGIFTTGCRWCRRRRDGSVVPGTGPHPLRHTETAGPNSVGCREYDIVRAGNAQGIDHELYAPVAELVASGETYLHNEIKELRVRNDQGTRFANRIVVVAPRRSSANALLLRRRGAQTDTVTAAVDDPNGTIDTPTVAGYAHGEFVHTEYEEKRTTQSGVNQRALELLGQLASTTEYVEATLPLNEGLQVGHVIRINGGDIGLNLRDHICRVLYVEDDLPRPSAIESETTIGTMYMRTEAPP